MRADGLGGYNAVNSGDLTRLRRDARSGGEDAVRQVAKQFESLFVQMMLKGMRDASIGDGGMFSNNATRQYQQLFDKQVAMQTADGQGFGIAAMVERQMRGQAEGGAGAVNGTSLADYRQRAVPAAAPPTGWAAAGADAAASGSGTAGQTDESVGATDSADGGGRWESPQAFVEDVLPAARRTAERLGVPPEALVAQAALETGWGARTLQAADGSPSFNMFNIKAHGWQGARVRVPTLEYRDGAAVREQAEFRAYRSVDEAFADYADFLQSNPRYRDALNAGDDDPAGFADALEDAGYATDPRYSEKLRRILDGPTLRDTMAGLKDSGERSTT
ncbi:flagellar assembly peptidoglycan hydrolase FlgJ [Arhodomonas aquaeolei]|uniref:flagellar assembly peptidoglycan hydrolase FlgJ n=1 Tax=Arhodomonas aquaeolei TaxID=2369 RepID=UPI0003622334|nr:flagellar assembly peptidoglycan hydrolase FlgJ [Arhodomonas aquaeolei]MCS4502809.1 flagellar assembly peptidoglycan hydrolase FlgJ [Arhodomonas aquaeolei]